MHDAPRPAAPHHDAPLHRAKQQTRPARREQCPKPVRRRILHLRVVHRVRLHHAALAISVPDVHQDAACTLRRQRVRALWVDVQRRSVPASASASNRRDTAHIFVRMNVYALSVPLGTWQCHLTPQPASTPAARTATLHSQHTVGRPADQALAVFHELDRRDVLSVDRSLWGPSA